jgi:integrase
MASASVKRVISSAGAILNIAIKEYGLERPNIFKGTFIPADAQTKKRLPVPDDALIKIQAECRSLDDQQRWMIALISDTGMRLSEACGLLSSDINLDCSIPHIDLIEHPWRRLKTPSSVRQIPLVGTSLWAAGRIKSQSGEFAFPKYCSGAHCNANSASAALNKWLRPRAPQGCVIHSFRHSLRDRLREVECPADVIDAIGGWATEGVGHQYGKGHSLNVTHGWMKSLVR